LINLGERRERRAFESASCSRLQVAPEASFVATFAFVHPADRIGLLGKLTETGFDTRFSMVDAGSVLWGRILVEERWDWDKFVVENGGGLGRIVKQEKRGIMA